MRGSGLGLSRGDPPTAPAPFQCQPCYSTDCRLARGDLLHSIERSFADQAWLGSCVPTSLSRCPVARSRASSAAQRNSFEHTRTMWIVRPHQVEVLTPTRFAHSSREGTHAPRTCAWPGEHERPDLPKAN